MTVAGSRRIQGIAAIGVLVLTLSACGSSDVRSSSRGAGTMPAALAELAGTSTYGRPPAKAPAVASDKKIWIVSCGQSAIGCQTGAEAAKKAAETVGWTAQICDGKLNAGGAFAGCVRQGVAAKVDAIVTEAIDCAAVKEPLGEAKTAKITTINFWGFDCDTGESATGEKLFTESVVPSAKYRTNEAYQQAIGVARAEWVKARSGGTANVIELHFTGTNIGAALHEGFKRGMKECASCEVETVEVTHQSFGSTRQIIESALLKNPRANWVAVPLDSLVLAGAGQAVAGSPRRADVKLIGGEGLPPNLGLIRQNQGQSAAIGQPIDWYGWASIDTLIRAFAGEPPAPSGMGFQIIDSEVNLPGSGPYRAPVDFMSAYRRAWGL
ncbi:sugar ABC transporter substrate-binding protein [Actinomadura syzygii]|uniref:Sugar ABC transporter substrate-binding protein n=1 Tax=Actinomadura syzygii TaxID=1427538 RepID=A0A5D0UC09_9ACTN|nr:substrate-binding domain-containing protein [Actinomadura syzygii]TYC15918.1 sugar ABC transporter substrate-binding protein [Actinomadura syzygii]